MFRFLANNWHWLLWSVFILFLVSIPSDKLPRISGIMTFLQFDKLVHMILFLVLVWLMIHGLEKEMNGTIDHKSLVFLCILTATLFSGATEIYQHFYIRGRIASWPDFVANEVGCFAGWGIYKWRNSEIVK